MSSRFIFIICLISLTVPVAAFAGNLAEDAKDSGRETVKAIKQTGTEIKEGTQKVGRETKVALKKAGKEIKQDLKTAEHETKQGLKKAGGVIKSTVKPDGSK